MANKRKKILDKIAILARYKKPILEKPGVLRIVSDIKRNWVDIKSKGNQNVSQFTPAI